MRNTYEVLARVLLAAVEDRAIVSTPCWSIALPAVPDIEVVRPTVMRIPVLAKTRTWPGTRRTNGCF